MSNSSQNRYLIGIGVQKAATSWVHAALAAQPQVSAAAEKELDFFSARYDRGHGWYRAQWAPDAALRLEVSPSYFQDPRAPERLARFAPEARLILCLRDPVDRAYSHHLHEIAKGHIAAQTFETALEQNPAYLEEGRYGTGLARWLEHFRSERMLILLTEEMREDPGTALQRLSAHAGLVGPSAAPPTARNVSSHPRAELLRRALRAGGAGMRQLGLGQTVEVLRRVGPLAALHRWNEPHLSSSIAGPDPALRRELARHFAKDMQAVAAALGRRDLPWSSWGLLGEEGGAQHKVDAA